MAFSCTIVVRNVEANTPGKLEGHGTGREREFLLKEIRECLLVLDD